jgi:hypothetical protein
MNDSPTRVFEVPLVPAAQRSSIARSIGLIAVCAELLLGVLLYQASVALELKDSELAAQRQAVAALKDSMGKTEVALQRARTDSTSLASELQTSQTTLSQERSARANAERRIQAQTDCISSLSARVDELYSIRGRMSDNFNRTASGSVWSTASATRTTEVNAALDSYYRGFSAAYGGDRAGGNAWIAVGNSHISEAVRQAEIMSSEIGRVNQATAAIASALSSFQTNFDQARAVCTG